MIYFLKFLMVFEVIRSISLSLKSNHPVKLSNSLIHTVICTFFSGNLDNSDLERNFFFAFSKLEDIFSFSKVAKPVNASSSVTQKPPTTMMVAVVVVDVVVVMAHQLGSFLVL